MVAVSYLFHYGALLQNATEIIMKCGIDFVRQKLISQYVRISVRKYFSFVRKSDVYYKMYRYKIAHMRYDNKIFSKKTSLTSYN